MSKETLLELLSLIKKLERELPDTLNQMAILVLTALNEQKSTEGSAQ